jgi:siroheme synthase-like protein
VPAAYPILLDLTDKKIVIVGGGAVGLRKANKLIESGATDLTVVSPQFADGFPASVKKITSAFKPEHLDGAHLVFAATDSPAVNAEVMREARRRNALASRADEETGDFSAGASFREQAVTVAVWAESPALAAAIRDGLKTRLDPGWPQMAQAMQTLRPEILRSDLSSADRRKLFRALADEPALNKLKDGGIEALREWIEKLLTEGTKARRHEGTK